MEVTTTFFNLVSRENYSVFAKPNVTKYKAIYKRVMTTVKTEHKSPFVCNCQVACTK